MRRLFGRDVTELIPEAISAWRDQGILVLSGSRFGFKPMSRQEQIEAFLWMFPEALLERHVAERRGIQVRDDDLRSLVAPLVEGTGIGGGWVWSGVDGATMLLERQGERAELRLCPRLATMRGVDVVIGTGAGLPGLEIAQIAVQQAITANGSDALGPQCKVARRQRVFSKAGQHLPASAAAGQGPGGPSSAG